MGLYVFDMGLEVSTNENEDLLMGLRCLSYGVLWEILVVAVAAV